MVYIVNSVFNSITYIIPINNQKDCWLIDCGDISEIVDQGWNVKGVLLTHIHFDHIYGLNKLMEYFPNIVVYTNNEGKEGLMNPKYNFSRYHEEIDSFVFSHPQNVNILSTESSLLLESNICVDVLFTPGHDPSCLSFRIDDYLFTGDAYIPGIKTIDTFPRSHKGLAMDSVIRIQELEKLGLHIKPGHLI